MCWRGWEGHSSVECRGGREGQSSVVCIDGREGKSSDVCGGGLEKVSCVEVEEWDRQVYFVEVDDRGSEVSCVGGTGGTV